MKLHEYQAKERFKKSGIPVPDGILAMTAKGAEAASESLSGPPWVVKAQVHAGGRGKGGGVKIAKSHKEVKKAAEKILSTPLITNQTGPDGKRVYQVLVEEGVQIERELYLAVTVDRQSAKPVVIFSRKLTAKATDPTRKNIPMTKIIGIKTMLNTSLRITSDTSYLGISLFCHKLYKCK